MARETRTNGYSGEQMRVYAPANSSLAYNDDYIYRTTRLSAQPKRREAEPAMPPQHKPGKRRQQRPNLLHMMRENRFFLKLTAVVCLIAVASVAAFTVIRFFDIAAIQSEINDLNARITAEQRLIDDLTKSGKPVINATDFAQQVGLVPARPY